MTSYMKTTIKPADMFTKALGSGENRRRKVRMMLYDIYPEDKDTKDYTKNVGSFMLVEPLDGFQKIFPPHDK